MNKLAYGLLSLLSTEPMTGYDLTSRINAYWKSTHSAIYPLLSDLVEKNYVQWTLEKQNGKPDKKIYTLTEIGLSALNQWLLSDTSDAVSRDEMVLKLFCIKCIDVDVALKLFDEFELRCKKRIKIYEDYIDSFKTCINKTSSPRLFSNYMIIQRSLSHCLLDLEWCTWARNLYFSNDVDFLNQQFYQGGNK